MINHVELQKAFVLHQRAYKESSLLLEVITQQYGRISLLAKGAKRPRSPWRGILQPLHPLIISWRARSELGILTHAELATKPSHYTQTAMFSAFYLNELMIKLIIKSEADPVLFTLYQTACLNLATDAIEPTLRIFELGLLKQLGFGFSLLNTADTDEPIAPTDYYQFYPQFGLTKVAVPKQTHRLYLGEDLLNISAHDFTSASTAQSAKRLLRTALAPLLNHTEVHTRRLFIQEMSQ